MLRRVTAHEALIVALDALAMLLLAVVLVTYIWPITFGTTGFGAVESLIVDISKWTQELGSSRFYLIAYAGITLAVVVAGWFFANKLARNTGRIGRPSSGASNHHRKDAFEIEGPGERRTPRSVELSTIESDIEDFYQSSDSRQWVAFLFPDDNPMLDRGESENLGDGGIAATSTTKGATESAGLGVAPLESPEAAIGLQTTDTGAIQPTSGGHDPSNTSFDAQTEEPGIDVQTGELRPNNTTPANRRNPVDRLTDEMSSARAKIAIVSDRIATASGESSALRAEQAVRAILADSDTRSKPMRA